MATNGVAPSLHQDASNGSESPRFPGSHLKKSRSRSYSEAPNTTPIDHRSSQELEHDWKEAYNQLKSSVVEKDEQLAMVAELGKSLLEKNQQYEQIIVDFQNKENEKATIIEDLEQKVADLELMLKTQSSVVHDQMETQYETLHQEYVDLQSKSSQLQDLVTQLQHENNITANETKKKEKQYAAEITELKRLYNELTEQHAHTEALLQKGSDREIEAKKLVAGLQEENNKMTEKLNKSEEKVSSLEKQLNETRNKLKMKENEVFDLKDQIEEFYSQAKEYSATLSNLQNTITSLMKQNHQLQKENEHISSHCNELQQVINGMSHKSLSDELNAAQPKSAPATPTTKKATTALSTSTDHPLSPAKEDNNNAPKASLLSELEELFKAENPGVPMPVATPHEPLFPPEAPQERNEFGMNSLEESDYFSLTAAAVKIGLVLKFPEKTEIIFATDVKKLYEQATRDHIPFHEWHQWISTQLGNVIAASNATKGKAPEHGTPFPEQNEALHKLFVSMRQTEYLLDFFECQLDDLKGTIYLTQEAMYFYAQKSKQSNQAHDIRLKVQYQEIVYVRKPGQLAFFRRNELYIKTAKETKLTFNTFANLDESYESIRKLWQTYANTHSQIAQ
mmetsp:Transcript_24800/g.34719  ORF Transcript_24800/g.34719 Transcript_24800/m.34719 type:complete len:622 (-) Transcript_24800:55-1920(-)